MIRNDVIALTRKLIAIDTTGSRRTEEDAARYLGKVLSADGYTIRVDEYEPGRPTLIAEKGVTEATAPLVFSGHLDTVPLGATPWTKQPFAGEIHDGRLYGRGASDMKGGVAAMLCAAHRAFATATPQAGIRFIITAGEEPGCFGALHLRQTGFDCGSARAVIICEPTSNIPYLGHKGALFLKLSTSGKTAHSSMPELGDNAIYKAARAITRIENFQFNVERHPLHGLPTINVGLISGGANLNSVPDHAEFTVDIRSTPMIDHTEIKTRLQSELGSDITIETLVDLSAVSSSPDDPFCRLVDDVCGFSNAVSPRRSRSLSYMTDGAVLQPLYSGVPTIILGPGEPSQAHRTDEYCLTEKLHEAVHLYETIIQTF